MFRSADQRWSVFQRSPPCQPGSFCSFARRSDGRLLLHFARGDFAFAGLSPYVAWSRLQRRGDDAGALQPSLGGLLPPNRETDPQEAYVIGAPINGREPYPGYGCLIVTAARCWRAARDGGLPVQPGLTQALSAQDCTMLAPVFDSLLRLYEAALGRPIVIGQTALPSSDEGLLIALIDRSRSRACLRCTEGAGKALDCALCSTRIMMTMTRSAPRSLR